MKVNKKESGKLLTNALGHELDAKGEFSLSTNKNMQTQGFTSPRNMIKKHKLPLQSTTSSNNLFLHSTGLAKNLTVKGGETTANKNSNFKNSKDVNFSDVINFKKKNPTLDDLRNKMSISKNFGGIEPDTAGQFGFLLNQEIRNIKNSDQSSFSNYKRKLNYYNKQDGFSSNLIHEVKEDNFLIQPNKEKFEFGNDYEFEDDDLNQFVDSNNYVKNGKINEENIIKGLKEILQEARKDGKNEAAKIIKNEQNKKDSNNNLQGEFITPLEIKYHHGKPHGSSQSQKEFPNISKNYIQSKIEKEKYKKNTIKNFDIKI